MAKERTKRKDLVIKTLNDLERTPQIPLNEIGFDIASGGGVPIEVLVEIYGPNTAGKTTLAFEMAKSFLSTYPDKKVRFYNYERALDKFYVRDLLDNDPSALARFEIVEPEYLEDGMEDVIETLSEETHSLMIVDSLAAMTPKAEFEKDLNKAQVGGFKGKLMAEACRKMGKALPGSGCSIIFINHENVLLNVMSFVQKTTTPGGDALKYWASMRIRLKLIKKLQEKDTSLMAQTGVLKESKRSYGNVVEAVLEKNKFHPPYKKCVLYIIYGKGIDRVRSTVDYGLVVGTIERVDSQNYRIAGKETKVRGIDNFIDRLAEKPTAAHKIYLLTKKKIEERSSTSNPNVDTLTESDI